MRITLYLMTQKGFAVLSSIIENKLNAYIGEVILGRDKNLDSDFADEILQLCNLHGIKCIERGSKVNIVSDYSIAVSWRWLINNPNSKLIVFHDSLLPKYRGFAPLISALENGDTRIGVTAIFASQDYDTGDIIAQSVSEIEYPIKIQKAIDIVSKNYIELALSVFNMAISGLEIQAIAQNDAKATYSLWRDEDDYFIDWNKSATEILNFINAVSSPYKGAASFLNGDLKVRIFDAEEVNDVVIANRVPGKVIFVHGGFPTIVCGKGLLKIFSAVDEASSESILPLTRFRSRFGNKK